MQNTYIHWNILQHTGGNNLVDIDNGELFDTDTDETEEDLLSSSIEYENAPDKVKKEFDDYLEDWFKKNNDSVIFPGNVPLTFWDWAKERNDE